MDTTLWDNPGYYETQPNYPQYNIPGNVNWNTDTYQDNPSWWYNNSNTNYYGNNTGPCFMYIDPKTSHGQNTESYSGGNLVYRKSQQGQAKSVTVIPSISKINTQIHNSASPVINTYTSGITPRTWEDELGDWMRDFFNSHSEELTANRLRPWAVGFAVVTPGVSLANSAITLTIESDLFGNEPGVEDRILSVIDIATFGIGLYNIPMFWKRVNRLIDILATGRSAVRTYNAEYEKIK